MKVNDFVDVLGLMVVAGIITSVVTSRNTASQITAAGNAFSGMLAAALGKGSINR